MKAITLWQPWATLMALGVKRIETRSWPAPKQLYGQPLAIHAAKAMPLEAKLALRQPEIYQALHHGSKLWPFSLEESLGCVVAVVTFVMNERVEHVQGLSLAELSFGNYAPGRFGWITTAVRPLRVPMPVRGGQRIWNLAGVCRVCGCWEECACPKGCSWIEPDLCDTADAAHRAAATSKELTHAC